MANLRFLPVLIMLATVLIGGCASQQSLTPASSDAEFTRVAATVRAHHPNGGQAMWKELAALVRPKMNVRQMMLVLPPYQGSNESKLTSPRLVLWNGQSFFMRYALDNTFGVQASGIGTGTGEGYEHMVLTSSPTIISFSDPKKGKPASGAATTATRPADE
ncbi:MAG: hypothetical protein ACYTF6_04745 [Planctomycetota bacterium]|jgi:uncharacterized protein YceK